MVGEDLCRILDFFLLGWGVLKFFTRVFFFIIVSRGDCLTFQGGAIRRGRFVSNFRKKNAWEIFLFVEGDYLGGGIFLTLWVISSDTIVAIDTIGGSTDSIDCSG